MGSSRVGVGVAHSSTSGVFFDGQPQALANSHLNSFANSPSPIQSNMHPNMAPVSGDINVNNTVLNSVASSGPSFGASSLVTDANSGLSGGPRLQRSASINTDSYTHLPSSPLSFSSNNISISGSSVIDGPSLAPQSGSRVPGSLIQESVTISQLQKKPLLDIKQEEILQQQLLRQILQRQDSFQLQSPNPQLQNLIQQHRLRQQQQQLLQSMPGVQRAQLLQQQQQQQRLQLRQQLQQQGMQPAPAINRPQEVSGVCSRRLMQYLYHQRQRPADNTFSYWRKFVAEYYSPRAKERWCLSLYDNVGHYSLGVFPQATMDAWQCDICCSKSGRGFEATFEVLPRLNEYKFGSGVIDELLFLDFPRECRFPTGFMMLEYGKAVQESVYEQLRVVREGQLRIIFTPDLKIFSWEFCARRHEELLSRRLVAPQVNQLLQAAQKCQSTIAESGSEGVSQQDLQTNTNMVMTAGRQLAKTLELQSLNDLGFSKRYVRCLQISEVFNSMKNLMDYCRDSKVGPIEGLKNFPKHSIAVKSQLQQVQEMEQVMDQNAPSTLAVLHPVLSNQAIQNQNQIVGRSSALEGLPQTALAFSNYQNMLMRQNTINSNSQQEAFSSLPNPNPNHSSNLPNSSGFSHSSGLLNNSNTFQNNSQALQQRMVQQLLRDVKNNGCAGEQKPSVSGQSVIASAARSAHLNGIADTLGPGIGLGPVGIRNPKALSCSDSSAGGVENEDTRKATDLPRSLEMDLDNEFMESGFFSSDDLNCTDYDWKA